MVNYTELVNKQREFFYTKATLDLAGRRRRIETFKKLLEENKQEIDDAIFADIRRHPSILSDVTMTLHEVELTLKNMDEWVQPHKLPASDNVGQKSDNGVPAPDPTRLGSPNDQFYLVREPLGVILIISPWNAPLICSSALIQAFAAGNTVILKPSELDPTYAPVIAKLVAKYFDEKEFAVVEGGVPETTELLKERFDHILYTGCPPVAKIIMAAASKYLTPVTLELGGKNPVFVDESADLALLAKEVVGAKIFNAGQACICTDYILTSPAMKPKVVAALSAAFDALGDMSKVPANARIVNDRHFKRLLNMLDKTKGKVVYKAGGELNEKDKFVPFHLVEVNGTDDIFMQEEIFGPLLAIMEIGSFDAALDYIKRNEKPLAAYIFTQNNEQANRFVMETSSGGVTVNGAFAHSGPGLPFGGVGNSGMGRLMGKYSFDMFTHEKPICVKAGLKPNFNL
ncbi:hypothetical protein PFISCL1PPCAC_27475 [Pristionchus fissidentatus]|uniref:Aldehyde dehydrogenase n=1 Tax=Pristionchus fissidentatus TaxID=1538716 RepID=A0AAV5X111_9BILA|nr:hypothetical protein PFISCL1PPCAC_27475 [Pristionchus fissidentatus]